MVTQSCAALVMELNYAYELIKNISPIRTDYSLVDATGAVTGYHYESRSG